MMTHVLCLISSAVFASFRLYTRQKLGSGINLNNELHSSLHNPLRKINGGEYQKDDTYDEQSLRDPCMMMDHLILLKAFSAPSAALTERVESCENR